MLHCAFTSAVHDPLHDAWHFASQLAEGGVPVHFALHVPPQFARHSASHCDEFPELEQCPLQEPSHVALQSALQSKLPGWVWHFAEQLPEHDPVHDALAVTLQLPLQLACNLAEQATWKFTGLHCAVQPPCVTTVHCASAGSVMFPHGARSARAGSAVQVTKEKAASEARKGRRMV
jgi:hypothetical protein